jgi:hypothetical protein
VLQLLLLLLLLLVAVLFTALVALLYACHEFAQVVVGQYRA